MSTKRIATGTGLGLGVILAAPAVGQADDFKVTNLNPSGAGSLREALTDADSQAGADRVVFKSKLTGTIQLEDQPVYISGSDLEVVGPGARQLTVRAAPGQNAIAALATVYALPPISATISGLTVTGGDSAGFGGGVVGVGEVDLTISGVTLSGNHSDGDGGGIASIPNGGQNGSLTIESSTISGNTADRGGGVYFYGDELAVRNSTISGNTAGSNGGGALFFTTPTFANSTVTDNQAADSGGGLIEYSGATLRGMIVAGNSASQEADLDDGPWETSFSIIGDTTDADIEDGGGNLLDVDPLLKPLANNGGPTDTHAFKNSPAKNAGPSDAPGQDQRGAPRKGQADIGSYEFTKCKGVIVNRVGTSGKDKLKGTKKKDGMLGLGGNDKLKGKKGKDGLCGGRGKDKLIGGPGKDKLNGGPGKDKEIQ